MIAYHEKYKDISHFRVDRMTDIEISDEVKPTVAELKDFNVVEYSKKVFRMFSGETEMVELEFDNSLINVIIDRFGKDIRIHSKTNSSFRITVDIAASRTFFGWFFMFGNKAKIIKPDQMINRMREMASDVMQIYCSGGRLNG